MLSVPGVFFRPPDRAEESDAAREKFFVPESDHLTLLHTYQQWKANGYNGEWCNDHFIQAKGMRKAKEVRSQLMDIMQQQKLSCVTAVEPEWLAELGPMFFSIKESDRSRLDQRLKERAAKEAMQKEMEEAAGKVAAQGAASERLATSERERQRTSIVHPGARTPRTPLATPRRTFGL
ncbi:hypothetical protein WJX84_004864 [Apatococcus fuscideae]|uniref:Uncharacterized protein n=1 Tax=Apatococcus fuscideae TaxID=2026836 RepID=A0AAW1RRY0_9CHLO